MYFSENPFTFWSHNRLGSLFTDYVLDKKLSFFVGETLIGSEGLNANIGIIIEGYASFGYLGVFLHTLLIGLTLSFFQSLRINNNHFGIFVVLVYLINTSFITSLYASHGLLFLILFSYFFLRENH